jgi:hypothetical protein
MHIKTVGSWPDDHIATEREFTEDFIANAERFIAFLAVWDGFEIA